MSQNVPSGGWAVIASFVIALALTIVPMPEGWELWRPDWVSLVLIYWVMALPQRIGLFSAWFTGLLVDVLLGSLLGHHALTQAIQAYLTLRIYQRTRLLPMAQQIVTVAALLAIQRLVSLWIIGFTDAPGGGWSHWAPVLSGALVWPFIFTLLRQLRRSAGAK